jgi:hypothetical protein
MPQGNAGSTLASRFPTGPHKARSSRWEVRFVNAFVLAERADSGVGSALNHRSLCRSSGKYFINREICTRFVLSIRRFRIHRLKSVLRVLLSCCEFLFLSKLAMDGQIGPLTAKWRREIWRTVERHLAQVGRHNQHRRRHACLGTFV